MTAAGAEPEAEPAAGPAAAEERAWPELLTRLLGGHHLSVGDTRWAMDRIMSGEATAAQIAGFAVALRAKGETAAEVAGLAESMLGHAVLVPVSVRAVDVVGTGGDRSGTVNISTMAAVVTAAAGAPVVKHGNRAASSRCGSADLLEALGVDLTAGPGEVAASVVEIGIGFCFAPRFHPALRHAGDARRQLGIPTVFNVLGPLTNPARPAAAAVGCGDARLAAVLARVFADRGDDVLVFRGNDGLDELTVTTTSTVWVAAAGSVRELTLDPERLGLPLSRPAALRGGDVGVNLDVARRLFAGERGAVRDAVVLNAGAALAAHAGLTVDLEADIGRGMSRAAAALDSGAAADLLTAWTGRRPAVAPTS